VNPTRREPESGGPLGQNLLLRLYQIGTGALKEVQKWGNVRDPNKIMDLWRNCVA
jgi:hypothetical protein